MEPLNAYVKTVYPFLENVIYSITVYEVVSSRIHQDKTFDPYEREFWVNIINNSIQMAIVDWCKVFGSERDNPFHYKNNLDFVLDGIDPISEKMVRFRNKFIAHKTKVKVPVPILNEALDAIFAFDEKFREEFDFDGYPTLKGSHESNQIRVEDMLENYGINEI